MEIRVQVNGRPVTLHPGTPVGASRIYVELEVERSRGRIRCLGRTVAADSSSGLPDGRTSPPRRYRRTATWYVSLPSASVLASLRVSATTPWKSMS